MFNLFPPPPQVEVGKIRGTLFLPPGDGPFQGVIDMFGATGGLVEFRSAMFASRGIASLALAYTMYKDLKGMCLEGQPYEYFEEAAEWLSDHPQICKGGVGVVGVSQGAVYGMCLGAYSSKVAAVVSINGHPNPFLCDMMHNDKLLLKAGGVDIKPEYLTERGMEHRNSVLNDGDFIPIWMGKAKHLFLISLDDRMVNPDNMIKLYDACPEEKKKDIEIVQYPGAGHLLEPPYNALCTHLYVRCFGCSIVWGGQQREHAHAMEHSWSKMVAFFRDNIPKS